RRGVQPGTPPSPSTGTLRGFPCSLREKNNTHAAVTLRPRGGSGVRRYGTTRRSGVRGWGGCARLRGRRSRTSRGGTLASRGRARGGGGGRGRGARRGRRGGRRRGRRRGARG